MATENRFVDRSVVFDEKVPTLKEDILQDVDYEGASLSTQYGVKESGMSSSVNGGRSLPHMIMKVDIAIITIREDEFIAVIERFKPRPYHHPGKRSYGISIVQTKDGCHYTIAIARCSEQGNDTSHKLANDMIRDLDPHMFLVVGIAGGVPHDEFTLGDVIVSTRIHNLNVGKQHEDGTMTFNVQGGIHPRIGDITSNLALYRDRLAGWNSPTSIGQERPDLDPQQMIVGGNADWRKKIQESLELHFGSGQNRLSEFKTGPIASSNHLIRNPLTLNRWRDIVRTILAVEMESAGVYEATQGVDRQYPVMAIRGISDIVGLERDRRWTAYACQTAAAFAHAFVRCGVLAVPARRGISRRGAILMGVGIGTGVVVGGISLTWRKKER